MDNNSLAAKSTLDGKDFIDTAHIFEIGWFWSTRGQLGLAMRA